MKVVERYLAQGYGRIKIKIKPGRDVGDAQAVRRAFPDIRLQVDANSAYTLETASALRPLDDLDLLLIEQPLDEDDLWDHRLLQAEFRTPICLDESILSARHARQALEMAACRVINIKAGRVGGLSEAVAIHDLCRAAGVPVWCGGMLETGVGRASNLALASLPGFTLPGDISATERYYAQDITARTLRPEPRQHHRRADRTGAGRDRGQAVAGAIHARQPGDQGVAASMGQSEYYDVHRVFLRSFTVRDIAEPLLSFDATTPAADAVAAMTARGFQVAGLRRDGSVKGYIDPGGVWGRGSAATTPGPLTPYRSWGITHPSSRRSASYRISRWRSSGSWARSAASSPAPTCKTRPCGCGCSACSPPSRCASRR